MISLVVAALVWVLIHVLISGGPLRPWLADRLGQKVYRALFALLSIASLAALFASYLAVKPVTPADTPSWLAAGLSAVQLLAMLLVVAGLSTVNPTTAGLEASVKRPDVMHGMLRVTRHPFLWGVVLWSASHLAVCRNAPGLILFGSIGLVALRGTWSIDRKRRIALGPAWPDFAQRTSNVPFGAILTGRQQLSIAEIGAIRIFVALVLWSLALWAHPILGAGTSLLIKLSPL